MLIVKRSEIFLADLGKNVGSEQANIRPVIIVQEDISNTYSPTTIIIPCTTNLDKKDKPHNLLLTPTENGLKKTSVALINQVKTIDKSRILKPVGILSDADMERIDNALRRILALD